MIREYALDPDAICEWSAFRIVADGLGFSSGRVIARYPKDWGKRAYLRARTLGQNDRKKIETWLADRAPKARVDRRRGDTYEPTKNWLDNAVAEHRREQFHAIISDAPDGDDPPILDIQSVDESKAKWVVARQAHVSRQSKSIGALVAPLFLYAREIRIIDPYFKADPDQIKILLACFDFGKREQNSVSIERIGIHVSGEQVSVGTASFMQQRIEAKWPQYLPRPSVVRWTHEYLHNRYILTERGGIALGDTLREHQSRQDYMVLLEDNMRQSLWDAYDVQKHRGRLAS